MLNKWSAIKTIKLAFKVKSITPYLITVPSKIYPGLSRGYPGYIFSIF